MTEIDDLLQIGNVESVLPKQINYTDDFEVRFYMNTPMPFQVPFYQCIHLDCE